MAARITSNSDLVAYEYLTDYDIAQLTTTRLDAESPPWASRHERAWTETLRRLYLRPDKIEESDISDTDVLKRACCMYVSHLACQAGASDRHKDMAARFYRQWDKECEEVEITKSDGSTAQLGSQSFRRAARA